MIYTLLDEPFSGTNIQAKGEPGYQVSIAGVGFNVDTTSKSFVQGQDSDITPSGQETVQGEQVGVSRSVWRRYRDSWHYGMGQEKGDKEDSIPYRYRSSWNIDVWSRWQFSLLHGVTRSTNGGKYNGDSEIACHGDYTFCFQGDTLFRAKRVGTVVSWVETKFTKPITSIDTDGKSIVVAEASRVYQVDPETMTRSLYRNLSDHLDTIDMIRFTKNRIIASGNNQLFDLSIPTFNDDGSVQHDYSVIYQGSDLNPMRWVDACDGLSCVYVIGGFGERWSVQRLMIADDGIMLRPPITSASLPLGEIGASVNSYLGMLFVGSSKGVRFAVMEQSGDIALGQLIPTNGPVSCGIGLGRWAWVGNPGFMSPTGGYYSGLARIDLSRFTEQLTPAYANDLNVEGRAAVNGVSIVGGTPVFSVSGKGLCYESDLYAKRGALATGKYSFGSMLEKATQTLAVQWKPLEGTVLLAVVGDREEGATTVGTFNAPSSISSGTIPIVNARGVFIEGETIVGLEPTTDRSKTPVITSIDSRAVHVPGNMCNWTIPLIVREVQELNGSTVIRSCRDDRDLLISLVATARAFTLRVAHEHWLVQAIDYEWRPEEPTSDGEAWQGVFIIKLREIG